MNLTYADILRDLRNVFGRNAIVSETVMIDWFVKFEEHIRAVYSQFGELVRAADFAHVNEMGVPMVGENW